MSEPENFLARWSRRKLDAEQPSEPQAVADLDAKSSEPAEAAPPEEPQAAEFDPATLPPIESIDAATDIRDFLKAGVPANLTRAALRRVWTSDPAIRDFIEIAENQWDFANASSIPGFGELEVSEELRSIAMQVMEAGRPAPPAPPEATAATLQPPGEAGELPADGSAVADTPVVSAPQQDQQAAVEEDQSSETGDIASHNVNVASQHDEPQREYAELPIKRPHGRALPE